jgi:methylated-DNA-protein-cysteine methyltransferase-like protein
MPTKPRTKSSKAALSKRKTVKSLVDSAFAADVEKKTRSRNFYEKVYAIVDQIPQGKVTTYGAIAETLGMKGSSRMVGHALNALQEGSGLPAQRVINRIGALSGAHHFGGYAVMRRLLTKEGVTFKGELVDMERHFWHPREL